MQTQRVRLDIVALALQVIQQSLHLHPIPRKRYKFYGSQRYVKLYYIWFSVNYLESDVYSLSVCTRCLFSYDITSSSQNFRVRCDADRGQRCQQLKRSQHGCHCPSIYPNLHAAEGDMITCKSIDGFLSIRKVSAIPRDSRKSHRATSSEINKVGFKRTRPQLVK